MYSICSNFMNTMNEQNWRKLILNIFKLIDIQTWFSSPSIHSSNHRCYQNPTKWCEPNTKNSELIMIYKKLNVYLDVWRTRRGENEKKHVFCLFLAHFGLIKPKWAKNRQKTWFSRFFNIDNFLTVHNMTIRLGLEENTYLRVI